MGDSEVVELGGEHHIQEAKLLIIKVDGDKLEISYEGVSPLEAPAVLKLAAKIAEKQLGL